MQDLLEVTGIVIKSEPSGEYDRRVVILTKQMGKISCFAKGARKINNRFMASTLPFSFGEFKLYAGRNSYSLNEANISNYFEELKNDFEKATIGMYFLEIADYFTRENNDEIQMLKLVYQSLKALVSNKFNINLVRSIFEIKAICINGEYPGIDASLYEESTVYAMDFIYKTSVERLYTFTVSESVLSQMMLIAKNLIKRFVDRPLKSLELIE